MRNTLIISTILALSFYSCEKTEDEAIPVKIYPTEALGFDDFNNGGAAFCVAIDTVQNISLIAAFRYSLPLSERTFNPMTSVQTTIDEYNWNRNNSITTEIKAKYPSLSDFMTDTQGIRTMGIELAVFAVLPVDSIYISERIFVATDGHLELTRSDGPSDQVEGDLTFMELTASGSDAKLKNNGEKIAIEDIYFIFDTSLQPE